MLLFSTAHPLCEKFIDDECQVGGRLVAGKEISSPSFRFWLGKVFWREQDAAGSLEDIKILTQMTLKSGKEK